MTFSSRIGPVAALAIAAAGLTTQVTSASAAALPPAGAHARPGAVTTTHAQATRSAAARPGRARSHPAAVIRPKIKPAPGFGLTSRPPARNARRHPAFGGAAAVRAKRAAAFRVALAATQVPDTCSGLIQPDTIYPCTTPSSSGTDTFTLSLTSSADLLLVRILDSTGNALTFTVTAPDSSTVSCQQPNYFQLPQCPTSQAGTYTLQVQNGGGSYTLAYLPLLSDTSCAVASPSFAAAALTASLAAAGVGACYTLAMTTGQILHANSTSQNVDLLVTVYDSTGTQICFDDQGDCPLTGTGPYRVAAYAVNADAITYDLELNDISNPQRCRTGPQLTYGSAPDTSSANRCRTLTVATAGQYQVYAVSPQPGIVTSTLLQPDGTVACTNVLEHRWNLPARRGQLRPRRRSVSGSPAARAVFIAANEGRGCKLTGTRASPLAPRPERSRAPAEICLTLPTTVGPAVYLLNQPAAGGNSPQLVVVDATGAQICPDFGDLFTNCALTGTAPFRIILSGQSPGGGYQVLAQASDSTKGCAVWPQSGFGGSWGARCG